MHLIIMIRTILQHHGNYYCCHIEVFSAVMTHLIHFGTFQYFQERFSNNVTAFFTCGICVFFQAAAELFLQQATEESCNSSGSVWDVPNSVGCLLVIHFLLVTSISCPLTCLCCISFDQFQLHWQDWFIHHCKEYQWKLQSSLQMDLCLHAYLG